MFKCKSKSKGIFQNKHFHCKYTVTNVILLFNVTPSTSTHRFQGLKSFFFF